MLATTQPNARINVAAPFADPMSNEGAHGDFSAATLRRSDRQGAGLPAREGRGDEEKADQCDQPLGAPTADARKRILIVDDHPMVRQGMACVIEMEADLVCCGQAGSAEDAIGLLARANPDLVIVDITLPGRSGFELIKDLQAIRPELPALVFSMHDELFYAERALRAGAKGYVNKEAGAERMVSAIRQVLAGVPVVSAQMTSRILGHLSSRHPQASTSPLEQLTDREFEVYELVGEGKNTKEIAAQLRVCEKTVAVHRDNIRRKLELGSAAEVMRHAVRWVESHSG